ncbi:unnamed protein product [Lymnaea stagnalis]|uniref:Uncharacterized protein n=1 Tax=Lymnaea stagnalis TaxID=6523 RepID=A0AAV2HG86_LYMST
MFNLLFNTVAILLLCAFTHGQTINLYKVKQEDIGSKCVHGLISGDSVVFKAVVDYSKDPQMSYVQIYIKKTTDALPTTKEYNLQKDCYGVMTDCRHIRSHIAEITITVIATKMYSAAKIYGKLITSNSEYIDSKYLHFPKIYDVSDIKSTLIVNGKQLSTDVDKWVISVNVTEINIVCLCESQASPCLIEISTRDTTESVEGNGSAIYNTKVNQTQDIYVTIKYGACTLDRAPTTIHCSLKADQNSSTDPGPIACYMSKTFEMQGCQNAILITAAVTSISILVIIAIIYLYRHLKPSEYTKVLQRSFSDHMSPEESKTKTSLLEIKIPGKSKSLKDYTCVNNQGHENYYPVKEFEVNNIDSKYRSKQLHQLILDMADLTVSVLVSFKSKKRPQIDRTEDEMSPNNYINEKKGFRLKTGMIINLIKYSGKNSSLCPCQTCKFSGVHSSSWGKVFVLTSSTVVYDDNEAEKSCLNLFYNSHSDEAHILYGSCVSEKNAEEGWCIVECATCDSTLLDTLDATIKRCRFAMAEFNKDTPRETTMLVCIVSHPHDFPKQITMGTTKKRECVESKEYTDYTRYTYTNTTCHGSAGAFVYIHGVSDILARQFHVHLGVTGSGTNYCSIGKENTIQ